MSLLVSATFKSRSAFETATARLERIGVTDSQIGLVMSDETRSREFANRPPYSDADNAEEGAAAGATAGGLVGALFGAVTLAGALFIPGLNIVVAGPVLGALTGLAVGAGGGGLIGALIGEGLSEYDATTYEDDIKNGAILVAVHAKDEEQAAEVREILFGGDMNGDASTRIPDAAVSKPLI